MILGILKHLHDEMMKGLAEVTAAVVAAIAAYKEFLAAKEKVVAADVLARGHQGTQK